jgi:glycosyltransferase A (GT-A) superfamily protein (DUF2064 family)
LKRKAVLVFARRPELGLVKTRLETCIGAHRTLSLYRAFLTDTLLAARQSRAQVILAHTPGPDFPEQNFADITLEQRGNTFGERFDAALEDAANQLPNKTPLVLIGADTPHLSPQFLRRTFDILSQNDAVIGPSTDGGFYLLGFSSRPVPMSEAFSEPSTANSEAVRLLHEACIEPMFLQEQFDVDCPQDLMKLIHLINHLQASGADWIPQNTRRVLNDEEIIPLMAKENAQTVVGMARESVGN